MASGYGAARLTRPTQSKRKHMAVLGLTDCFWVGNSPNAVRVQSSGAIVGNVTIAPEDGAPTILRHELRVLVETGPLNFLYQKLACRPY